MKKGYCQSFNVIGRCLLVRKTNLYVHWSFHWTHFPTDFPAAQNSLVRAEHERIILFLITGLIF